MRRAVPVLLVLSALVALAGCGDDDKSSSSTSTTTSTSTAAATTTPATTTPPTTSDKNNADSPYVVVTSLLGKPLPKEPGCRFAKSFIPGNPSAAAYDGSLALTVTCQKEPAGYTPTGQIVNRPGSKPTEITCRDTSGGQLYCIYVPSTSVGLYFTGTDRATVRRRLEHLIEVVSPLPTGITPLAGTSTP